MSNEKNGKKLKPGQPVWAVRSGKTPAMRCCRSKLFLCPDDQSMGVLRTAEVLV